MNLYRPKGCGPIYRYDESFEEREFRRRLVHSVSWEKILDALPLAYKKEGDRALKMPCPFHGGRRRNSAYCYHNSSEFHCYSCQWHGDKIDFIQAWMHPRDTPPLTENFFEVFLASQYVFQMPSEKQLWLVFPA